YAMEVGTDYKNLLTFRYGGIGLFNKKKGFYDYDPVETGGRVVLPSTRNFEHYANVQWDCESGGTGGCITQRILSKLTWDPFVSADLRFKTIYNYAKVKAGDPDRSEPSLNLLAGFIRRTQRAAKGAPGLYLRYYHGVNPAGQ